MMEEMMKQAGGSPGSSTDKNQDDISDGGDNSQHLDQNRPSTNIPPAVPLQTDLQQIEGLDIIDEDDDYNDRSISIRSSNASSSLSK